MGCSGGPEYDLCVIGAGPGGYVGAIKAAQLGLKTVCIDKRGPPGGTCLNVGCIPSKALLQSSSLFHEAKSSFAERGIMGTENLTMDFDKMMANKNGAVSKLTAGVEGLFKRDKVEYLKGHGKLTGPNSVTVTLNDGGEQQITAKNIMLATGSEVLDKLPFVEVDEETIVSSTGALTLKQIPKKMIVIGGGVIGLELGSVYERIGSEVTVVEYMPGIGGLGIDGEVAKTMEKIMKKQGMNFKMSTKVTGVDKVAGGLTVTTEPAAGGAAETMEADVVLVCVGRRVHIDNLGTEDLGIKMDGHKIAVDDCYARSLAKPVSALSTVRPQRTWPVFAWHTQQCQRRSRVQRRRLHLARPSADNFASTRTSRSVLGCLTLVGCLHSLFANSLSPKPLQLTLRLLEFNKL